MEKWSGRGLIKFSKGKVLHQFMVGADWLETALHRRTMGWWHMNQHCAFVANKANGIQGCIRSRDLNFLLHSALMRPQLEFCVQYWTPQYRRESIKYVQRTGASLIWGEVERAGYVYPGEERAWRELINVYKCLKGMCKEKEARLFSLVFSDRTTGNGKTETPEDKETLVYCETDWMLSQIAQRSWSLHSWRYSKSHLDMVLGSLLLMTLLEQMSFPRWPLQVSFRINDTTWNRRWWQDTRWGYISIPKLGVRYLLRLWG